MADDVWSRSVQRRIAAQTGSKPPEFGPPARERDAPDLSDGNRAAALMLASGRFADAEIVETTGLSSAALDIMRASPLFQATVARFRDKLYDEARDRLMADLMADAGANLAFIKDAREGRVDDNPQMLAQRTRAALALLDRALPAAPRGAQGAPVGVQIVIAPQAAARIEAAFTEAEIVDG